jgi:hypothetical protein
MPRKRHDEAEYTTQKHIVAGRTCRWGRCLITVGMEGDSAPGRRGKGFKDGKQRALDQRRDFPPLHLNLLFPGAVRAGAHQHGFTGYRLKIDPRSHRGAQPRAGSSLSERDVPQRAQACAGGSQRAPPHNDTWGPAGRLARKKRRTTPSPANSTGAVDRAPAGRASGSSPALMRGLIRENAGRVPHDEIVSALRVWSCRRTRAYPIRIRSQYSTLACVCMGYPKRRVRPQNCQIKGRTRLCCIPLR